jgi:Ice-binding-like
MVEALDPAKRAEMRQLNLEADLIRPAQSLPGTVPTAEKRLLLAVLEEGISAGKPSPRGLYTSTSSLEISSGDLTLDAQGDANAVFIFKGNILADQSITLNTGATLDGRALARIGAVTLDTNSITKPAP